MKGALALLAAVGLGCVSQETYDKLQAEHDRTLNDLRQKQTESTTLAKALQDSEAKAKELGAQVEAAVKARAKLEADLSAASSSRSQLEGSVEAMRKTLADLAKRKEEAEGRVAEFRALLDRFKALIDAGKLNVKIVEGKMVVSLPSDVLFASGSANLSKEGKAAIAEVAQLLASIPERKFQIEGHTDNVPTGPGWKGNWQLAASRALTVLNTMVDAGMPPERVSAASYGQIQPAQPNDTPEGKAANRRIEIVVVPDLSGLPGFEELENLHGGA